MNQQKIGGFLRELRKEKGLTQEQIAESINVSGRTISRWETGSNMPDISLLVELAEFYGVSIPEIINGERKKEDMNEELKEVTESLSDYAEMEKKGTIIRIRTLSIMGVCALFVYAVLDIAGLATSNDVLVVISNYCLTLVFVCTILTPAYTTGLINRIEKRRKQSN